MEQAVKVLEFMQRQGLFLAPLPGWPTPHGTRLDRVRVMTDEFQEMVAALHEGDQPVDILDAGCDLIYTVLGAMLAMGLTPQMIGEGFDEVHRSNMTKGKLGINRKGGKGPDFEPPQLAPIVLGKSSC